MKKSPVTKVVKKKANINILDLSRVEAFAMDISDNYGKGGGKVIVMEIVADGNIHEVAFLASEQRIGIPDMVGHKMRYKFLKK